MNIKPQTNFYVSNQIANQNWGEVGDLLYNQLSDKLSTQLRNHLWDVFYNQLSCELT